MNKQYMKFAIAFAIGIMVVIGVQAYQQAQLDNELFNAPSHLTIRLVPRSSAFEWTQLSTTTITAVDVDGNTAEVMTLYQPVGTGARQGESILVVTRWDCAEYTYEVKGDDFDDFTFTINPYLFRENVPWQIKSSINIIYDDWTTSSVFIIWIGLGH